MGSWVALWLIQSQTICTVVCGQRLIEVLRLRPLQLTGNVFKVGLVLFVWEERFDATRFDGGEDARQMRQMFDD